MRTKCSSVTGGDPSADADGDGQKNLSENKAGTHPLNPLSVRIPSVGRQPDQSTTITFSSVSGKRHRAEYSTSLGAGATWYVLATDLNGTGANLSVSDPCGYFEPGRSYRVVLLP